MKQTSISDILHITGNIIIEGSKFVNQIEKNINGNKKMQKKKKYFVKVIWVLRKNWIKTGLLEVGGTAA